MSRYENRQAENTSEYMYVVLREKPQLKCRAAEWFCYKWGVPQESCLACMEDYLSKKTEFERYLCLDKEKIKGG